jgi:hypothetical protein
MQAVDWNQVAQRRLQCRTDNGTLGLIKYTKFLHQINLRRFNHANTIY